MENLPAVVPEELPNPGMETLEHALGISHTKFNTITWAIDEMFSEGITKAEAIQRIAKMNLTNEEQIWAGYILCRKHVSLCGLPGKVVMRSL